jgi:hypothetical protein
LAYLKAVEEAAEETEETAAKLTRREHRYRYRYRWRHRWANHRNTNSHPISNLPFLLPTPHSISSRRLAARTTSHPYNRRVVYFTMVVCFYFLIAGGG